MAVLKDDKLRSFRIDIETDSTIQPNADNEQKNRIELISSVTGFLEKALPAVAQGMLPKKFATELLIFGVRAFKTGPQIEELLDEWAGGEMEGQKPQQPQAPDPAVIEAQKEAQQQAFDKWKTEQDNDTKIMVAKIGAGIRDPQEVEAENAALQQFTQQIMGAISSLAGQHQTAVADIHGKLQQMSDEAQQPAEIIRDAQGRPQAIRKGGKTAPVLRGPDGKAVGLGPMTVQ